MTLRWVRTKDHSPGLFAPRHAGDDDWLLLSGGYVVGRVLAAPEQPQPGRFTWSLTGPHTPEAPVATGGAASGEDAAKAALVASWRAWQAWAGQQDAMPVTRRPQDPHLDGRDLTFETLEHGGAEPDTMPNAIRVTDPQGRSAVYVLDARRDPET